MRASGARNSLDAHSATLTPALSRKRERGKASLQRPSPHLRGKRERGLRRFVAYNGDQVIWTHHAPVVALVGRPNVGKSTLFNVLTRSRDALVADMPGVTRDRHYGVCRLIAERHFVVVDTGGLVDDAQGLAAQTAGQVDIAVAEADAVLLVVDAREGLLPTDRNIVDRLRRAGKPMILVVNKTDGLEENDALAEFAALGIANPLPVSAAHNRGVRRRC